MDPDINSITENYRERIQRLALFEPLYKLENKKGKDNSSKPIDYFSLGLLTLLFFFENMLIRNKKTGVKELTSFFQKLNNGEVDLDFNGFEKVARSIIETFRPPTGKRNSKSFYNWETRREETVQYSILKADKADLDTNTQYYTLDEQGLELIFATKEYFNEFQLSINQLVLRKQLEKGEFQGALRQIDEMSLDVKNLEDRMFRIKHEVQRNIISIETEKRYEGIVNDVNDRLERENEEFQELISFVKEIRGKLGNDLPNKKDKKAYELIIEIDRRLSEVHFEHTKLLKESIILKTSALQAAQESLYYVGIDSFNFKQEITSKVFSSPLPLNSARRLIEPFLYLERHEEWSPLTVFAKQRLETGDKQEKPDDFLEIEDKEEKQMELKIQRENFKKVMEIILEAMHGNDEITLEYLTDYMKQNGYEDILNCRPFYDFWIILHQKSPVMIAGYEKTEGDLFGEAMSLAAGMAESVGVYEIEGILNVTERYTIRNMKLKLEDNIHDLQ